MQNPDLDFNDDGNLDVKPWKSIMDSLAFVGRNKPCSSPGAACNYSETTVFLASHVYRCTTANDWTVGEFDIDER